MISHSVYYNEYDTDSQIIQLDKTRSKIPKVTQYAEATVDEIGQTSQIYVDMDGVLADFFGDWKKLVGKDWRKITDIGPALQKIRDTDNF